MRGGSRPGAGRPRIYGKRVQLSILISEDTKARLKELAAFYRKPLAGVIEQLIRNTKGRSCPYNHLSQPFIAS